MSSETSPTNYLGTSVIDLTDEELAAIDPVPVGQRLVVMPWFDGLKQDQQQLAIVTAMRGLVARGLVQAPSEDEVARVVPAGEVQATVTVDMDADIARALTVRRSACRVVAAQRTAGSREDHLYLYESEDGSLLAELVEPKGLHRLGLPATGSLAAALEAYLLPGDWPGYDGEPMVVDAQTAADSGASAQLIKTLGSCWVQAEFVVRLVGSPPRPPRVHGLSAGPDGIYATCIEVGRGEPVTVTPITRADARRWLSVAVT